MSPRPRPQRSWTATMSRTSRGRLSAFSPSVSLSIVAYPDRVPSPRRILFYTGKGGVGKTSVAAATALRCAKRGARTMVISTDLAHSLGDAFDRELGAEPVEVAPNLWAHESDVMHEVEKSWGAIQSYIKTIFQWRGIDDVLSEEMSVLPGMDELAALLRIADHHDSGKYDVVVVDAAPT